MALEIGQGLFAPETDRDLLATACWLDLHRGHFDILIAVTFEETIEGGGDPLGFPI